MKRLTWEEKVNLLQHDDFSIKGRFLALKKEKEANENQIGEDSNHKEIEPKIKVYKHNDIWVTDSIDMSFILKRKHEEIVETIFTILKKWLEGTEFKLRMMKHYVGYDKIKETPPHDFIEITNLNGKEIKPFYLITLSGARQICVELKEKREEIGYVAAFGQWVDIEKYLIKLGSLTMGQSLKE